MSILMKYTVNLVSTKSQQTKRMQLQL